MDKQKSQGRPFLTQQNKSFVEFEGRGKAKLNKMIFLFNLDF
jgi:hypothetical protein